MTVTRGFVVEVAVVVDDEVVDDDGDDDLLLLESNVFSSVELPSLSSVLLVLLFFGLLSEEEKLQDSTKMVDVPVCSEHTDGKGLDSESDGDDVNCRKYRTL